MMESLRAYILSVVTAAILCGLVSSIAGKKTGAAPMLKLLGGLFLALTVIRPVAEVKVDALLDFTKDLELEAEAAAALGEEFYQDSLSQVISEQTSTYILDKAQTLNARISVDVALDSECVPCGVMIRGQVSPYAKAKLEQYIASDLGITKERQTWIG